MGRNNVIETCCIDDDQEEEEEVYDWGGNGANVQVASSRSIVESGISVNIEDKQPVNDENQDPCVLSDSEHSEEEWRNSLETNRNKRGTKYYNYSLPVGKQCVKLKRQMSEFKEFLTLPIVMKRQSARVENSTLKNAISCALRYLGYCLYECKVSAPTLDEFKNIERLQNYFDWLLNERSVQAQTIDHYLNTAVSVLKFLHRDEASPNNRYKDIAEIEILRQVRRQIRGLVRFEPPSHEHLSRMKKWLPWDQIIKTLSLLKNDYETCLEYSSQRARCLMEYLMVALYVYFPPVRARPIRQLAIGTSLIKINGMWHLDLRKYKTFKVYGPVVAQIHDELVGPLEEYLNVYRPLLLYRGRDHSFVFTNRSGEPFTAGAWTYTIQSIFRRKTGQTIGTTLLRDSFVTYVYSQDISQELKESIALHMGHRVDTAKRVYDRRTSAERRQAGINFASSLVQRIQMQPTLLNTSEQTETNDYDPFISAISFRSDDSESEQSSPQFDKDSEEEESSDSDISCSGGDMGCSEQVDLEEQSDSNFDACTFDSPIDTFTSHDFENNSNLIVQEDLSVDNADSQLGGEHLSEKNTPQPGKRTSREESNSSKPKRFRKTPVPWWQQTSTTNHTHYYWEGVQMLE